MPGAVKPENPKLAVIPRVEISDNGSFKYILCTVTDPDKPADKKMIVRGTTGAEFHADIYDDLDSKLEEQGVTCQCLGGGKIKHDPKAKTMEVYGLSQGYGKANHAETVSLLRVKYPGYNIKWKDD